MLMKKILSVILALMLAASLAGCSAGNQNGTDDETTAAVDAPVISVVCDKATVTAGEEIEVKVHIGNAPLTACFDIYVMADDAVSYISSKNPSSELILASNLEEEGGTSQVVIRGMVASTYDVLDENVCIIKYKVSDAAAAGTKISFSLKCPLYQVGLDESGNDVYSVEGNVSLNGLVLEVI